MSNRGRRNGNAGRPPLRIVSGEGTARRDSGSNVTGIHDGSGPYKGSKLGKGSTPAKLPHSSVIVIDDQATSRKILDELVRRIDVGIEVHSFADGMCALDWVQDNHVDLVITDYKMPEIDGVEFIRRLRRLRHCREVPVVVITIVEDRHVRYEALEAGATDFLTKPFDHHECRARCRNLLTMRHQQRIIHDRASWLERQVSLATVEIRAREQETLLRLAKAGEFRDEETSNHVLRVARYARLIADELGLPPEECEVIELAAALHDIGKVGIADGVLRKSSTYTPAEMALMREHTRIGHQILKDSPSKFLQMGSVIALSHHERFDGQGYPNGLAGDAIPMPARMVAVADVYDALTTPRPYKRDWSSEAAFLYLGQQSGLQFDPACVEAFLSRKDMVLEIQGQLRDHREFK